MLAEIGRHPWVCKQRPVRLRDDDAWRGIGLDHAVSFVGDHQIPSNTGRLRETACRLQHAFQCPRQTGYGHAFDLAASFRVDFVTDTFVMGSQR